MVENNGHELAPFGQSMENMGLAKDLTGFDKKIVDDKDRISLRKLFLTLSNFDDTNQAEAYASAMHKAMKNQLWDTLEELVMRCMAKVSVKGQGRSDIIDILTQIQMMRDNERNDDRKSARKPQAAAV